MLLIEVFLFNLKKKCLLDLDIILDQSSPLDFAIFITMFSVLQYK